jgi:hypothetical protein
MPTPNERDWRWAHEILDDCVKGIDIRLNLDAAKIKVAAYREEIQLECAERAIKFYDLGFSPGQADDLRAAILGDRKEGK